MRDLAGAALDAVLERPPHDLVGALLVGLALSLVSAGAYLAARRRVGEVPPLLVALMLVVSLASATLAIGYVRCNKGQSAPEAPGPRPAVPWVPTVRAHDGRPGGVADIARLCVETADRDRDGVLSPAEEARIRAIMAGENRPEQVTSLEPERPGPP